MAVDTHGADAADVFKEHFPDGAELSVLVKVVGEIGLGAEEGVVVVV